MFAAQTNTLRQFRELTSTENRESMKTETKIKPWAAGPLELLRHAEGHRAAGTDFDRRMALISYDNAIEVSIASFLTLHPKQRGGLELEGKKVEEWQSNYHKKLEFLEHLAKLRSEPLGVSIDEVIYYHNIRNELYHGGNGLVPETNHLDSARSAAFYVFLFLFGVNPEAELAAKEVRINPATQPTRSAQSIFLETFIEFEKALQPYSLKPDGAGRRYIPMPGVWHSFVSGIKVPAPKLNKPPIEAVKIRNEIVHGNPTGLSDTELAELTEDVQKMIAFVRANSTYAATKPLPNEPQ